MDRRAFLRKATTAAALSPLLLAAKVSSGLASEAGIAGVPSQPEGLTQDDMMLYLLGDRDEIATDAHLKQFLVDLEAIDERGALVTQVPFSSYVLNGFHARPRKGVWHFKPRLDTGYVWDKEDVDILVKAIREAQKRRAPALVWNHTLDVEFFPGPMPVRVLDRQVACGGGVTVSA